MSELTILEADVRLVRGGDEHQHTAPAGEAITAGMYIRLDTTTGKFVLGNATTRDELGEGYFAGNSAAIGETVTGYQGPCVVNVGAALAGLSFGDPVFVDDTDGKFADATGTVELVAGTVVSGFAKTTAEKLLKLQLGNYVPEPLGS